MICLLASHALIASVVIGDFTITNRMLGKTYVSTATDDALVKSPIWGDQDANPPVSARTAMALAKVVRDKLVEIPEDCEWQQASLQLLRRDIDSADPPTKRWIWLVNYHCFPKKGSLPGKHTITLMVLMDGSVVKPTAKNDENPADKSTTSK